MFGKLAVWLGDGVTEAVVSDMGKTCGFGYGGELTEAIVLDMWKTSGFG